MEVDCLLSRDSNKRMNMSMVRKKRTRRRMRLLSNHSKSLYCIQWRMKTKMRFRLKELARLPLHSSRGLERIIMKGNQVKCTKLDPDVCKKWTLRIGSERTHLMLREEDPWTQARWWVRFIANSSKAITEVAYLNQPQRDSWKRHLHLNRTNCSNRIWPKGIMWRKGTKSSKWLNSSIRIK